MDDREQPHAEDTILSLLPAETDVKEGARDEAGLRKPRVSKHRGSKRPVPRSKRGWGKVAARLKLNDEIRAGRSNPDLIDDKYLHSHARKMRERRLALAMAA